MGPQLHSTRRVLNSRRCHLRIQKASQLLAAGDPTGGAYTAPRPGSRPSPKPHPRSQLFGFSASALRVKATEGPQVTVEPGPTRALLCHCSLLAQNRHFPHRSCSPVDSLTLLSDPPLELTVPLLLLPFFSENIVSRKENLFSYFFVCWLRALVYEIFYELERLVISYGI